MSFCSKPMVIAYELKKELQLGFRIHSFPYLHEHLSKEEIGAIGFRADKVK